MTSLFQPKHDFTNLVDGLEEIKFRRHGSAKTLSVSAAYREQVETQEAEASGGRARQSDAFWQLQMPAGESAPQLGDVVIDRQAQQWTILEVQQFSLLGRWRCTTRNLCIAYDCHDRVDVERAVWEDQGSGLEIVDWKYVTTALPVRIQPLQQEIVDVTATPPTQRALFQIILGDPLDIAPDDRLMASDGTHYRVQSLRQAGRLDALPTATAVREG